MTSIAESPLKDLLTPLEPDQRLMLEEAPREGRLPLLAQFRRESELETVRKIAQETKIRVLDAPDARVPMSPRCHGRG